MTLPCPLSCPAQFSVVLQSVEEVSKGFLQPASLHPSLCVSHTRHQECCHNTSLTHFSLPIPLVVTQSFHTDISETPPLSLSATSPHVVTSSSPLPHSHCELAAAL